MNNKTKTTVFANKEARNFWAWFLALMTVLYGYLICYISVTVMAAMR